MQDRRSQTESLDVIAVGVHPDDVEVACGGTLAKLSDQGYRVGIVDLTDGEPTPHCPDVSVRLAEATKAAQMLGVSQRVQLNLPNRRLFDGFEARVALARVFRQWRPRIVIGFGDRTPMASPDHYQAMLITEGAIFYSRLSKWDDHFDELPTHRVDRHLYFRMPMESDSVPSLTHHITVDISGYLGRKIAAAECYRTQFDHKPGIMDRVRAAALVTGSAAGVKYGESFAASNPFAVSDLVQSVLND